MNHMSYINFSTYYSWKSGTSGSWTDSSKWAQGISPDSYVSTNPNVNDNVVFATGSAKPYTVSGLGSTGKLGNLTISHDTVNFMQSQVMYNRLGDPYTGSQINITNYAHVSVNYHSYWNGNPGGNDHSTLAVSDGSTLMTDSGISGFVTRATNGSTLTVQGYYATLNYDTVRGPPTANESMIDKTSSLIINSGAHVSGSWLDVKGIVAMTSGTLTNNANGSIYSTVEAGGHIYGSYGSVLAGSVINSGTIESVAGIFHITASVTNSTVAGVSHGSFVINPQSVLDLGATTQQSIKFLSNAELDLAKGVFSQGLINNFGTGDKIDLVGQAASSINTRAWGTGTIVDFKNNAGSIFESIAFNGSYSSKNLYAQVDGHGGTLLGYGQAPGSIHIS